MKTRRLKKTSIIRRSCALPLLVAAALTLTACDSGFDIRISETKIQSTLSEKLPLEKTYLKIFDVTLNNPRVDLLKENDRVQGGLDVVLVISAFGKTLDFDGTIDASGGVHYVPDEEAFYMTDPVVEALAIEGLPEKYKGQVEKVIASAIEEFYASRPVYRLEDRSMKESAAGMVLKDVKVGGDDLVVTLGL